jgi:pantoate--beta-alanine ligase
MKHGSNCSSELKIFDNLDQWIETRRALKRADKTIGFVPTMGALHAGHASLLERSRRENDIVVLSIFVNPTQFDNKDDLAKYPVTLDADRDVAAKAGVDFIILPNFQQIYPDGYRYKVSENDLSTKLCGAHRPGHFDGVLTIVMKLLNIVQPERAYFGEKDFQQLQLVKGMVESFFMDLEIVPCSTLREADGLAMSSRNVRLTPAERELAPRFVRSLREAVTVIEARARLESEGFDVDYIEDIGNRRYGAVKLGNVRLIDNVER